MKVKVRAAIAVVAFVSLSTVGVVYDGCRKPLYWYDYCNHFWSPRCRRTECVYKEQATIVAASRCAAL